MAWDHSMYCNRKNCQKQWLTATYPIGAQWRTSPATVTILSRGCHGAIVRPKAQWTGLIERLVSCLRLDFFLGCLVPVELISRNLELTPLLSFNPCMCMHLVEYWQINMYLLFVVMYSTSTHWLFANALARSPWHRSQLHGSFL